MFRTNFTHCVEYVVDVGWQIYVKNNARQLQFLIDIAEIRGVKLKLIYQIKEIN